MVASPVMRRRPPKRFRRWQRNALAGNALTRRAGGGLRGDAAGALGGAADGQRRRDVYHLGGARALWPLGRGVARLPRRWQTATPRLADAPLLGPGPRSADCGTAG